ncbi:MAG: ATP-binding protein [Oligoflexales bacterium]|nr:ATP-binding protein [Oligoflexales bacterium]
MYIERALSQKLLKASRFFPAIVLTGARQVGKSTFLKRIFPDYRYVTLDSPLLAEEAESNPEIFLRKYPPPVIIDEVQYATGLFRHLKIVIDANPADRGSYILTGSQKFELMKGVSESLAGRIAVFEMEGLSLQELDQAGISGGEELDWYIKLLQLGGFPQLWVEDEMPLDVFFPSYTGTYLERDVRQLVAVANLRDFERFLRACALRSGQLLNKSELARDVGIAVSTAGEWLGVLHALGHIVLLEPWFSNMGKRLSKSPKLYLRDVGLLCHLLGLHGNDIINSPVIGSIWETFVFSELRKQIARGSGNRRLWFYRDQSQAEIDFILEEGFKCTLFECKWSSNPDRKGTQALERVAKAFAKSKDYKVVDKVLLSRSNQEVKWDDVHLRPLRKAIFDHPEGESNV